MYVINLTTILPESREAENLVGNFPSFFFSGKGKYLFETQASKDKNKLKNKFYRQHTLS